jgi:hypothetical protein
MFTWLNKQGVRSDLGFEVQFTGRFSAEYREGPKKISLRIEDGYEGGPCIILRSNFERWDNSTLTNSPEEQTRMLKNFKDAIEFQGLKLAV